MAVVENFRGQGRSPRMVPGQGDGDADILVDAVDDGAGHPEPAEDGRSVAAPHQRAGHGDHRQRLDQAIQRRLAARPANGVEHDIGEADRRNEAVRVERR